MSTLVSVLIALIVIVALLLVLVIMVQNPKGGGLSNTFGGGGGFSMGGVQSTNTFLDKSTWTLATVMVGLVILTNILLTSNTSPGLKDTRLKNEVENTTQPAQEDNTPAAPAAPVQAPADNTPAEGK